MTITTLSVGFAQPARYARDRGLRYGATVVRDAIHVEHFRFATLPEAMAFAEGLDAPVAIRVARKALEEA